MVGPPHGLQPDLKVVPDVNTDEEATLLSICAPNASDALQGWPSAAAVHQAPVAAWAHSQDLMEQSCINQIDQDIGRLR